MAANAGRVDGAQSVPLSMTILRGVVVAMVCRFLTVGLRLNRPRIGLMPRLTGAVIMFIAIGCLGAPGFAQQAPAAPLRMIGGGEVMLRQERDVLFVTVTGPRAGLASLCIGDESRVRIL